MVWTISQELQNSFPSTAGCSAGAPDVVRVCMPPSERASPSVRVVCACPCVYCCVRDSLWDTLLPHRNLPCLPSRRAQVVMASNPYTKPLRQLCDANLLRPEPRQCASEKNLKNAVNAKLPDDSEHRLTNINGGRRPTDAAKLAQFDRRARWWAEALRGVCGVDATQTSAHDHECGVHGQCHLPGWAFGEQARAAIPLFRFSPLFLRCPLPSKLLPLSCVALAGRVRVRWGQEAKAHTMAAELRCGSGALAHIPRSDASCTSR